MFRHSRITSVEHKCKQMYPEQLRWRHTRVQTRSRMAQNFGYETGSPDLYRPNLLPENIGPCHKYARFDRKSPYQVRARFHWDLGPLRSQSTLGVGSVDHGHVQDSMAVIDRSDVQCLGTREFSNSLTNCLYLAAAGQCRTQDKSIWKPPFPRETRGFKPLFSEVKQLFNQVCL
jgi:hypothetical protein